MDTSIVTIATGISFLCSIATLTLNTRTLGIAHFGELALVQALVSFVSGLTTFDNWQPIVRFGVRSPQRLGLVLSSGVALDVFASFAAGIVAGLGLILSFEVLGLGEISRWTLIPYWFSLLVGLGGTPKGYFRLNGRFDVLAHNQVATAILQLAVAATLWANSAPLEVYLLAFGLLACLPGLSLFVRMMVNLKSANTALCFPWSSSSRRRFFRVVFRVAMGNSVLSTLATSRYQINLFVVAWLGGDVASGLFAAAARGAGALTRFFAPIGQIAYPEILRLRSSMPSEQAARTIKRITIISGLLASIFAVVGILGAGMVMTAVGGKDFIDAADAFRLLIAAELLVWAGYHFTPYLITEVGQKSLLVVGLITTTLAVSISALLAPRYGALGGGLGVLAGSAATYVALHFMVGRVVRQRSDEVQVGAR